jgi:hypothetical protein
VGSGIDPTVADKLTIAELIASYALAVDCHDNELLARLFSHDAVLAFHGPGDADGRTLARGRGAIVSYLASLGLPGGLHHPGPTAHVTAVPVIAVQGDDARAETRCAAHHRNLQTGVLLWRTSYLRYVDRFRRAGSHWELGERRIHQDLVEWGPVAGSS